MKSICIFLSEVFEEMEAMFPLDILRRGGMDVKLVSVTGEKAVRSSHGVTIMADALFEDVSEEDVEMIVLPGGLPGATNLDAHAGLDKLILSFANAGKPLAAICAAPMVYGKRGLLKGKKATCYPGFEDSLLGASYTSQGVITDGNITTSRGLGYALDLGLELIRLLQGPQQAERIREAVQYDR